MQSTKTYFYADHNSLENDTQALLAVTINLPQLPSLRRLDLSFNRLSFCPPAVSQLTGLTHLDLAYNRLETIPDQPACHSLAALVGLQVPLNVLFGGATGNLKCHVW